jgi:RNA polymerase sigma-70 factor (ECF subfamily)
LVDPLAAELARDLDGAFERFVEAYEDRVFGFALTLTGDRHDAEEVAQDAFVSAYEALRRYDGARRRSLALRAWLFTIVLNKVRNRARRSPTVPLDGARLQQAAGDGPERSVERAETIRAAHGALAALAPRYRVPVVLRHVQQLSYAEIAQVLKQPVGTAKANVHRGLGLLRAMPALGEWK